jgi:hypothetical protein
MIAAPPAVGPSPTLPLRYLAFAAGAYVLAAFGVMWVAPELTGHYYQPRLLALTHLVTLGWISLSIMGASYQIVPIVLGQPVWSERAARWQFWMLAGAIPGMVAHFFLGTWPGLLAAALLLVAAIALHLVNVAMTIRGFRRWTFSARAVALGYTGLALTGLFGLMLGANHLRPFLPNAFFPTLHAHVHLALLGWITPMMLGVSARVYPMFLLAPEPPEWAGRLQFWGLAAGVPAVVVGLVAAPALVFPGALAVAVALIAHLFAVVRMARGRRRPALDWGLRFTLTAAVFALPAAGLGLAFALGVLAGPRPALAYAVLALGGWVSFTIAGMMLKIVPFLVWYHVYGPRVGRGPIPTLPQLSWPRAEALAHALLTAGTALLSLMVAAGSVAGIRVAGSLLALGAVAFAGSLACSLRHLAVPAPPSRFGPPVELRSS